MNRLLLSFCLIFTFSFRLFSINSYQKEYSEFLYINAESYDMIKYSNKKESLNVFKSDIMNYIDSMSPIKNWSGYITNNFLFDDSIIAENDSTAYKILTFNIQIECDEDNDIFNCYRFNKIYYDNSYKYDLIYKQVKNITDLSKVYFSGKIIDVIFHDDDVDYNISPFRYIDFKIDITNISIRK